MSLIVTPEKPLRANAVRAASRIDSRVRSDFRAGRGELSDDMRNRFGSYLRFGIDPARPPAQRAKARPLRCRQAGPLEVLLVLPDPDVIRQGELRRGQPRLEIASVFRFFLADPVAGEDVRSGVVHRC